MDDEESGLLWESLTAFEQETFKARIGSNRYFVHYTNFAALKGILESEEFWFSSASMMNDYDEIVRGKQMLEQMTAKGGLLHDLIEKIRERDPVLWDAVNELYRGRHFGDFYHTYLSCWSECDLEARSHDDLTMWRGYAADGNGVAIAIDGFSLGLSESFASEIIICPVFYETHDEFGARALRAFQTFYDAIVEHADLMTKYPEMAPDAFVEICFYLAVTHKHPGFAAEKEWRFAWRKHRVDEKVDLVRHLRPVLSNGNLVEKFCFPIKPNEAVTPAALDIRSIVKAIMIGPCDDGYLKASAATSLLATKGFVDPASMVQLSEIPYRPSR